MSFMGKLVACVLLAAILLFGGASKEWLHHFADHTDTVHTGRQEKGAYLEKQHHHCKFLEVQLSAYLAPVLLAFSCITTYLFIRPLLSLPVFLYDNEHVLIPSRAPPGGIC